MIPKEILDKVRRIQILTSRMVTDVMAGQYESVFKGRGMEFSQVRSYEVGDDIRNIDWNVTARTGSPHVKEFVEERELTVMLLVDASTSLDVGTGERSKRELATELCAVIAFCAVNNNDKVGLIIFTDDVELFVPPKKGKRHVLRVIRELLAFEPKGKGTNIQKALEYLGRVTKRRSVAFLCSDFLDEGFEADLTIASRRHDLVAVSVADQTEHELGRVPALIRFIDPETGEEWVHDGWSDPVRQDYGKAAGRDRQGRRDSFRKRGLDLVEVRTDQDYVKPLVNYFREREGRR